MRSLVAFAILSISLYSEAQLPNYVPTTNLMGWYSYNGNVLDYSGNGNNNASYSINVTTDRFNDVFGALYFSGNGNEYINYGDVDDFEGISQLSLSFWVLPEDHGQGTDALKRPIISKWLSDSDLVGSSYNIIFDGNDIVFKLTDGITADSVKVPLSNIPLNQWSHVAISFDSGNCKFYIGNNLLKDTTISVTNINDSNRDFRVGDWYHSENGAYRTFLGKIDDLGIWNRALNDCEVEALNTTTPCSTSDIENLSKEDRKVIKVFDIMGRETEDVPNQTLIYLYNDGTIEKVFRVEK